jgi:hypothetical protein
MRNEHCGLISLHLFQRRAQCQPVPRRRNRKNGSSMPKRPSGTSKSRDQEVYVMRHCSPLQRAAMVIKKETVVEATAPRPDRTPNAKRRCRLRGLVGHTRHSRIDLCAPNEHSFGKPLQPVVDTIPWLLWFAVVTFSSLESHDFFGMNELAESHFLRSLLFRADPDRIMHGHRLTQFSATIE